MTTVTLPADLEAWAREQVASGRAPSVDGLVADVLRQHREISDRHKALVEEAYRSVARGDVVSEEEMDAEFDRWLAEDSAPRK